jgi:hypothetical protein
MNTQFVSTVAFFTLITAGTLGAQELPSMPAPVAEHAWLEKFEGEWVTQSTGTMGPDQPPMQCTGTLTSRSLGGFWVLNEMKTDIAGDSMTGLQTIGYSEEKKKYVGTWVDSITAFMWRYEGTVDASGKVLTLQAEGPSFTTTGKMTDFQDIYEFKSKDEMVMTSKMLGDDGKWITFMTGTAKRRK